MNRLWKLAKRKDKLKKKLAKITSQIEEINEEALSYKGKGTWGQDVFIRCLVENLHFEADQPKRHLMIVKKS